MRWYALGAVAAGVVLALAYGPSYLGYDAAWSLVWGAALVGRSSPALRRCVREANVVVASMPVASSNAPSSSRSQAYVSPRPGLSAVTVTGRPARGKIGSIQMDGTGRLASHVPFLTEMRTDEQPNDS
jgi:hypothetical protein